jgi:hypothetical protein
MFSTIVSPTKVQDVAKALYAAGYSVTVSYPQGQFFDALLVSNAPQATVDALLG